MIIVEIHAPGQSRHNTEMQLSSIRTFRPGQIAQMVLQAHKNLQIDTPKHACYESNDHSLTGCVDKLIEKEMGCRLPWLDNSSNKRLCDQHGDLLKFIDIMTRTNDSKSLREKHCFKPNCNLSSWIVASSEETLLKTTQSKNGVTIHLILQESVPVTVQQYSIAYGFSHFVADFGGYLGLLLGASLLSLYDDAVTLLRITCHSNRK